MTRKEVSTTLIQRQAEELQDLSTDEGRSAELASEVDTINRAGRDDAQNLEFDDEPLGFSALMGRLARETQESPK